MSDDAREARHLFEVVTLLCWIAFGIPLALVLLEITGGLWGSPIHAAAYKELGLFRDLGYAVILGALAVIPTLGLYVWYKHLA